METHKQDRFTYFFTQAFKITFMVLAFSLIAGGVVMWLWNALMPDIFGLTSIGFWQAIGLIILSKILFSGFGGKGSSGRHNSNHWGKRWSRMDDSQKQAFKDKLRNKYCEEEVAESNEVQSSCKDDDRERSAND